MKIDFSVIKMPMDIGSDELYLAHPNTSCFRRLEYIEEPLKVGVDIGAHIGIMSIAMALRGFEKIYSYEPVKCNYDRLYNNILECEFQSIIMPYQKAVWDRTGAELEFRRAGNSGQHSAIYLQSYQFSNVCRTLSLVDVCKMIGKPIDYLKIDTEGAEHWIITPDKEVIKHLKKVRYIDLDMHDMGSEEFFDTQTFPKRNMYYSSSKSATKELLSLLKKIGFEQIQTDGVLGGLFRNKKWN